MGSQQMKRNTGACTVIRPGWPRALYSSLIDSLAHTPELAFTSSSGRAANSEAGSGPGTLHFLHLAGRPAPLPALTYIYCSPPVASFCDS